MPKSTQTLELPQNSPEKTVSERPLVEPVPYQITGTVLQAVTLSLNPGQKVHSQVGRMSWKDDNIVMKARTGSIMGMLSRSVTGEALWVTEFSCERNSGVVAFTPNLPGKIEVVNIGEKGKALIAKKGSFLASDVGVEMKAFFTGDIGTAVVGGRGLCFQKFTGNGNVFLEVDGETIMYDLEEGQSLKIDQNVLVGFEDTVNYEIQTVNGLKNILLSGEGLFLCKVTGPGKVWLQTQNAEDFADNLLKKKGGLMGFLLFVSIIIVIFYVVYKFN